MSLVNTGEISMGFYIGIGVALALLVVGMLQVYVAKATHRG